MERPVTFEMEQLPFELVTRILALATSAEDERGRIRTNPVAVLNAALVCRAWRDMVLSCPWDLIHELHSTESSEASSVPDSASDPRRVFVIQGAVAGAEQSRDAWQRFSSAYLTDLIRAKCVYFANDSFATRAMAANDVERISSRPEVLFGDVLKLSQIKGGCEQVAAGVAITAKLVRAREMAKSPDGEEARAVMTLDREQWELVQYIQAIRGMDAPSSSVPNQEALLPPAPPIVERISLSIRVLLHINASRVRYRAVEAVRALPLFILHLERRLQSIANDDISVAVQEQAQEALKVLAHCRKSGLVRTLQKLL